MEQLTKKKLKELYGTDTYHRWSQMKQRCNNPNSPRYSDYGGRGITVCKRWESFKEFYIDMGEKPKGLSLDRIDNSQGYSPENCQWSGSQEQMRNRRNNRLLTYDGRTQCAAAWIEEIGCRKNTFFSRIYNGWDNERIFQKPFKTSNGYYSITRKTSCDNSK